MQSASDRQLPPSRPLQVPLVPPMLPRRSFSQQSTVVLVEKFCSNSLTIAN